PPPPAAGPFPPRFAPGDKGVTRLCPPTKLGEGPCRRSLRRREVGGNWWGAGLPGPAGRPCGPPLPTTHYPLPTTLTHHPLRRAERALPYSQRSMADRAARWPFMPWPPAPGGVEAEHRKTRSIGVV